MAMEQKKKKQASPNILQYSTIIKNKWKTLEKLGQGAFGEIYAGIDLHTCNEVAIKTEKCEAKKMVLKLEVIALKKLQKSKKIVRYTHSGRQDHFNFLIMERLGENIATMRKRTKRGIFSLATTIRLGVQMIDCLESIHNLGYIHRDVKPSNFCLGRTLETRDKVFLIDFNLARRYVLSTGAIRQPRKHAGFRGTARYASINSHHNKELSRRDDLWSVFYVLVEFALGQLPWKRLKDKKHIGELKERFTNAELVKDLAPEFLLFMQHLLTLGYEDKPDYDCLRDYLTRIYSREGFSPTTKFDWDQPDHCASLNHREKNEQYCESEDNESDKQVNGSPRFFQGGEGADSINEVYGTNPRTFESTMRSQQTITMTGGYMRGSRRTSNVRTAQYQMSVRKYSKRKREIYAQFEGGGNDGGGGDGSSSGGRRVVGNVSPTGGNGGFQSGQNFNPEDPDGANAALCCKML